MKITIFDVGHGHCTLIQTRDGKNILFDIGYHSETPFQPADYLKQIGVETIDQLFITNYDEDHIDGLPRLVELYGNTPVKVLSRNRSISPEALRQLKIEQSGSISASMHALLGIMEAYCIPSAGPHPAAANVSCSKFQNNYSAEFKTTNDLSLVTILRYGNFGILFGGDLEKRGWEELLKQEEFRRALAGVNIFVASHHGRENGYHEDVFRCCAPDIIVISDSEIIHGTQEHQLYRRHPKGVSVGGEIRHVLSTRNDGHVCIDVSIDGTFSIQTTASYKRLQSRIEQGTTGSLSQLGQAYAASATQGLGLLGALPQTKTPSQLSTEEVFNRLLGRK